MTNSTMKYVFVNGTFDVLHRGHVELLKYAKEQGDILIVAIDSDERVRSMKGPSRPVHGEKERLVEVIKPAIMIVGSDWKGRKVIGSEHAKSLKFFDRIEGYSSTEIIQRFTPG